MKSSSYYIIILICFAPILFSKCIPQRQLEKEKNELKFSNCKSLIDNYSDSLIVEYKKLPSYEKLKMVEEQFKKETKPTYLYDEIVLIYDFMLDVIWEETAISKNANCDGAGCTYYHQNKEGFEKDLNAWYEFYGCERK